MTQEEIKQSIDKLRLVAKDAANLADWPVIRLTAESLAQWEIALQLCRIADGLEAVTGNRNGGLSYLRTGRGGRAHRRQRKGETEEEANPTPTTGTNPPKPPVQ